MKAYILRRLLSAVPTLFGVAVVVFILVRLIPGDPAEVMLGGFVTEDRANELKQELGLTQPLPIQFSIWLAHVVRGDLGTSIISQRSVTSDLVSRFPATFELTVLSTFLAVLAGILLGIVSAIRHKSGFDLMTTVGSVFGMSVPIFWLALMLLYFFGVYLKVLPISGRLDFDVDLHPITGLFIVDSVLQHNWVALGNSVKHLILPAVCLGVIPLAVISRMTKASMLEVLRQDFITTAKSKGLPYKVVLLKHALKNALVPVMTVIGIRFGSQLAGAVLVEVVFAWPGLGRLVYEAIQFRDYPLLQGSIMFIAVLFVLINLLTDVLYSMVDPRIRYD